MLSHCNPEPLWSGVCVRGTKCCMTDHGCNRHRDCDEAERIFKQAYPYGKTLWNGVTVHAPDHCHDEECEECFGY